MFQDYVPDKRFLQVPFNRAGLGPIPWPDFVEYDISQDFSTLPPLSYGHYRYGEKNYPEGAPGLPGIDTNLGLFWIPLLAGIGATAGGAYLYGRIKDWWSGSGSNTEKNEIENEIVAEHLKYNQTQGAEGIDRDTAERLLDLLNTGKFQSWLPWALGGAAVIAMFFLVKK